MSARPPFWSGRVIDRAAEMFGVEPSAITGTRGRKPVIEARFLATRAIRQIGMTYPEIGARMHRDHSTVVYACNRADEMMAAQPHLRLAYEEIVNAGAPGTYPLEDAA